MHTLFDLAVRPTARGSADESSMTLLPARGAARRGRGGRPSVGWSAAVLVMFSLALAALSGCGGANRTERSDATRGALASAADSANWDFERGDFAGWRTLSFGSGAWHVYSDGTTPPDAADSDPRFAFRMPAPPQGKFAAATDMRQAGVRILHRTVKLDGRSMLRLTLFYESAGPFSSPSSLDYYLEAPNQQFRVELLDAAAPVTSMAAKHVLVTIFQTAPGDRAKLRPHEVTVDLSRWAGQSVRLRIAQVDNRGPLRAGVDNIRLEPVESGS
jgi:hypothetical protein